AKLPSDSDFGVAPTRVPLPHVDPAGAGLRPPDRLPPESIPVAYLRLRLHPAPVPHPADPSVPVMHPFRRAWRKRSVPYVVRPGIARPPELPAPAAVSGTCPGSWDPDRIAVRRLGAVRLQKPGPLRGPRFAPLPRPIVVLLE